MLFSEAGRREIPGDSGGKLQEFLPAATGDA